MTTSASLQDEFSPFLNIAPTLVQFLLKNTLTLVQFIHYQIFLLMIHTPLK